MIFFKTEKGLQVLKDRSVRLTPRQRSAFILFDGTRNVAEVLQASQGLPEDVALLVQLGLLAQAAGEGDAGDAAEAEPVIEIHAHSVLPVLPALQSTPEQGREPVLHDAPWRQAPASPSSAPSPSTVAPPFGLTTKQRFQRAYPLATQLTASLGARGLRLNLAAEAATTLEQLIRLRPRIRAALGPERTAALDAVLGY